jgi:lysozyme family protein
MADFIKAFKITILGNEGGYNPGIGEKETYMGIDSGATPHWDGWKIIDQVKSNPGISIHKMNLLLNSDNALQQNIHNFYQINYWNPLKLNQVNDQQIANNLFDCSVNQGEGLARKLMQLACNSVIAFSQTTAKPLVIDKQIGSVTLSAINALPAAKIYAAIDAERQASYRMDSGYAEWGKVWEKRLIPYTS